MTSHRCARNVRATASLAVVGLLIAFGAPATVAAGRPAISRMEVGPCPGSDDVLCGTIKVPLRRGVPAHGSISVSFRVYRHFDDAQPALEPIVAIEGGPGYGSIGSAVSYRFMIGSLHRRHDLIVMDQRGTGTSGAIDCPGVQRYDGLAGPNGIARAVSECAALLGNSASDYGTVAAGDDLADILRGLGVDQADVYGDSYGSFAAQSFALHHPHLVRALILDGTYDAGYHPLADENGPALRHAWRAVCARSGGCAGGPILRELGRFARRFGRRPLTGSALDADGHRRRVVLTAEAFAQLVYDATYVYTPFRDLPAALVAFRHGVAAPLLRLAAEDGAANAAGGSASGYSDGDLEVVSCTDYPTAWDIGSGPRQRRSELAREIARLPKGAFFPFDLHVWLGSLIENELVYGCLDWPLRRLVDPPFPSGIRYPDIPVLILNGEFDQSTPVFDARMVAQAWARSTFVEVPNTNHVTAEGDMQRCTSVILQRFVRTLVAGNTDCVRAMPPVSVVPAFPERVDDAPLPAPSEGSTGSDRERRAGWVAAQTVADAFSRWHNLMYGSHGHGLYGGTFTTSGPYESLAPVRLRFRDDRFSRDLGIWGTATWDRIDGVVRAALRVRGPGSVAGTLHIRWVTAITDASQPATVVGTLTGHDVSIRLPAPWVPQS